METLPHAAMYAAAIGAGATALIDLWALVRRSLFGTALPNYGLVGRWVGHMARGQFRHRKIADACPIGGEQTIGWAVHYGVGITFAAILVAVGGIQWTVHPTLVPALAVGLISVAAPFLLMQPGMGAGLAASRTPRPAAARIQSITTHAIFGLGLYASGLVAASLYS